MKKNWKIDYDQQVNNFEKYTYIKSDLIYGMPNDKAFISYVIPVYKRADLLEKTLNSVLNQQEVDFEWNILVVDNEAGDINDTQRLIEKINSDKIVYYRNRKNIGVDGNYNRCIELAQSPWIAMIHGDDLIMDDHLKCNAEYIRYIEKLGNKRRTAYICQPYFDFANERNICLKRNINSSLFKEVSNNGKPQLQSQLWGIITGYYATLPSFGTIMNREILMSEGGYSDELGICEDVITPFKIAKNYDVYMAPVIMGFHRFDRNESMKTETVLRIYEAMIEFREYMYTTVWWGGIWRLIARDILNKDLRNYCIGQSRFCGTEITSEEFNAICEVKEVGGMKKFLFNVVQKLFSYKFDVRNNKSFIFSCFKACQQQIESALSDNKRLLVYGAGMAANELIPILVKKYNRSSIIGCAVTEMGNENDIKGISIHTLDSYLSGRSEVAVITATVNWEFQSQMNEILHEEGFDTVINLLF